MTATAVNQHPEYLAVLPDWVLCGDAYAGERRVKDKGETYLPATPGHKADGVNVGQEGKVAYDNYRARAVFPSYVEDAVDTLVGMMHAKPATIDLPPQLEPLRERATPSGLSLLGVLRQINQWQLLYGRGGGLVEIPSGALVNRAMPYLVLYHPLSIINWDDDVLDNGDGTPQLFVLNESGMERDGGLSWKEMRQYRVLATARELEASGVDISGLGVSGDQYLAAVLKGADVTTLNGLQWTAPSVGGTKFEEIPMVVFNSCDISLAVDRPPLLKLASLCMAIYRGEADYRQSLFMQGQDTLVVIGADLPSDTRLGAAGLIQLPSDCDAKFIGVSSDGLAEQREALESDRARAADYSVRLFGDKDAAESGAALRSRVAAKTASIMDIVRTGAEALTVLLRHAAVVLGADPAAVVVTPNTDFAPQDADPASMLALMNAKALGLPLSEESIHEWLRRREVTNKTYEEEQDAMANDRAYGVDPSGSSAAE